MHETLHSDVIGTDAISSNELCRYLELVLRWAAGAKVERTELVRKAVQPVSHLFRKPRNWHRVIFQNDYTACLLTSPHQRATVIPVGTPVVLVNQQVSAKRISQPFSLRTPGMMTHHKEFNFSSHQLTSNKKTARWRLLSEYQGVASHLSWLK
jgi:hypothetical protein